jgi:long-chain fatty acid transport protein
MARARALPLSLLLLVGLSSVASVARASPLIETTGSVGGNAGVQGVVSGPGAASTYFNPALLIDADDELLLGFAMISEQLGVTLDGRPAGADVPLVVGTRGVVGPDGNPLPPDIVPTQWLKQGCPPGSAAGQCPAPGGFLARPRQAQGSSGVTRTYLTLGFAKQLVKDRLAVGIYAMMPISNFTTAQGFYVDEREALFSNSLHPELYGDRLTAVSVVFGAAFKLLPSLAVGAALSVGLTNAAASQDYVQSATDYSTLLLNNKITTTVNVSPTAGLRFSPIKWLRIGAAVHAPESFDVNTSIDATLPTGTESGATQKSVFDWMPWAVAAGVEIDVLRRGDYTASVTGSANYAFWSSYRDRQGQSPSVYAPDLGFRDTPSGAIGLRHKYKGLRAFTDLRYVPSPVPPQTGRSNYVDNDRFGVSLGADILLDLLKLRPGIQLFADRFIPRYNKKDDSRTVGGVIDEVPDGSTVSATGAPVQGAQGLQTNNPGWPGFSSGGWLWGGAVTLSMPL